MDRNLLGRATDGSDAPTPGYLYIDLAKAATANPSACLEMAQYLTRKLSNKQNPNIKTKCCKVIAKLAEQVPRNQFRRCIAQDPSAVAAIKEAINFRGPMDPLQGDAKNEKVRNAAKEALEAVYTESPDAPAGTPMQGISASYASAPHAGGGYGGPPTTTSSASSPGPKRMEGIGNRNYSDPRLDPRYNGTAPTNFVDAMKEAGDIVKGMIQDPLARNIGNPSSNAVPNRGHSGNLPGYGNNRGTYGGGGPPGAAELRAQTGGQWTMASNRGPGAVGAASTDYGRDNSSFTATSSTNNYAGNHATSASAGRVGGSWGSAPATTGGSFGTPSVTVNHAPSAGGATNGATPSDGTYEKNMILELCPPGGLKPVPPPDKLANFARAVGGLNPDLVCPVLLDFLEEGQPWIIRAKALCVMETAVQNGIAADGSNPYKTFFHACADEIQPLAAHPRAAIKDPAKRVLLLVGVTPGPGADVPTSTRAAAPVAAAAAPNLLEFDDGPTESAPVAPSQPPPPPPVEAPPAPPSNDMFGGMTMKGGSSSSAAPVAPAPVASAPPAPSGLLDFGSETTTPAPAAVADPFAASPAPAPADTSGAASMFGNLSVKDSSTKTASQEVAETAPTGSAFGFINNSDANPPAATPTPAPVAPPAPTSQPATFDPLKGSATANNNPMAAMAGMTMPVAGASPQMSQQKMMSMSPQQMQAMAYQQMMMQQQQQYMQMMAMRGSMPPAMPFPTAPRGGGPPGGSMKMSMGVAPANKDDKKFDFVKDTMSANMKK